MYVGMSVCRFAGLRVCMYVGRYVRMYVCMFGTAARGAPTGLDYDAALTPDPDGRLHKGSKINDVLPPLLGAAKARLGASSSRMRQWVESEPCRAFAECLASPAQWLSSVPRGPWAREILVLEGKRRA